MKLKQAQGFLVPAFLYKNISIEKKIIHFLISIVIIKNFFRNSLYMELLPRTYRRDLCAGHSFLYFLKIKVFFKKF